MAALAVTSVAPILIILFYLYIRDKYEKEPIRLLVIGVLFGIVITYPIIHLETFMLRFIPMGGAVSDAFYTAFAEAALVEESMKFIVLFFLTWRNSNLNEWFDGIVYAAFISLGFSGFENVLYVFNPDLGGMNTALMRAFISVPGHAFFGVTMGYYFSMAKLEPKRRFINLVMAFLSAYIIHGLFDFILLSGFSYTMPVFVVFLAYMWFAGFRKMKRHLAASPFKRLG